jgi:hypothetical protein
MDAETPAGGRDKKKGFASEKRRKFHRGTLTEPYLGGCSPSTWMLALEGPWHHPTLGMFWGGSYGSVARVAAWRGPRRDNVFLQEAYATLKRDNVTLERG